MESSVIPFPGGNEEINVPVGGTAVLRDFSPYLPAAPDEARIPWETKAYRLIDSTPGQMLYVRAPLGLADTAPEELDFSTDKMPPVLEIRLPFSGTYAITAGIPLLSDEVTGVDLALDGEIFTAVLPVFGGRRGRLLGERGREYQIFWKNAVLRDSVLRIRVPYGTFNACDLGYVRAMLSSISFQRLPDGAPTAPVSGAADKDFIIFEDGFSEYALYGVPGECFDVRLNQAYAGSDVKIFMAQVMGPLLWKSEVNSYLGEGATPEQYRGKRTCDVRVIRYVRDSVEKQYEVFRAQTEMCHKTGAEMHFSIRANLYWPPETKYMTGNDYMNGRWWSEHPDCRLPGSYQLDYGRAEVREYYLSVFRDALERFDLDGVNLDLTRWPRCLDARYHSSAVLLGFCRALRDIADGFSARRGKHIKVSLSMVEYYHAGCTLEEQAIDFSALAASGTLDFICLQAQHPAPYAEIAHKHGMKLYSILEETSPYYDSANKDPLWALPDGTVLDDPCAGEEYAEHHPVMTAPAPFENYRSMDAFYREGADGTAKINDFLGTLYFRDCGHSDAVRRHAEDGTVFGQCAGEYLFLI